MIDPLEQEAEVYLHRLYWVAWILFLCLGVWLW
jgi:hypothetical protein